MPKKLNISSNERVDLNDFSRASSDYTQESGNFAREKLIQARKTAIASGFRIEVSDQAAAPGEFTIYNGVGLDRDGNILNNEQQINDGRTLTLSGTSVSYYIEVEFVESESDVDSRAFWDPTYSGNTPPGKEFSLNVATRLTPDWQLVSPVSSSDFDITGNVNSNKIPIAVLTLDGSGLIALIAPAENIASSLEEDALGATLGTVTQFKVLDSSLFPITGTGNLGFGTPEAEAVNITGNDRTNGLISVSTPLVNDHNAGAVFVQTTVAASFVPEDKSAIPSSNDDRRSRLFSGNENRGAAVGSDPQDSSQRADLQVTSLKNYVDFLAAQLRELKFGNPRTDINSTAPPSDFSSTRHYDNAGSVTGARTATITIGDGVSSFGDFNFDTLNQSLTTAITALDVTFGGTIYVKAGTYAWGISAVSFNRPVNLVFDKGVEFAGTFTNNWITLAAGHEGSSIKNMPAAPSASNPMLLTSAVATEIEIDNCTLRLLLSYTGATKNYLKVTNSILESNQTSVSAITLTGFRNEGDHAVFEDCTIRYNHTVDNTVYYLVAATTNKLTFNRCSFDAAYSTGHIRGYVDSDWVASISTKLAFTNCEFTETNTAEVDAPFKIVDSTTNQTSSCLFDNCIFDMSWKASGATEAARTLLYFDATTPTINGCNFSAMGAGRIANTSLGNEGHIIYLTGSINSSTVSNCQFGEYVLAGAPADDFVCQVTADSENSSTQIVQNSFNQFYKAVNSTTNPTGSLQIDNNVFLVNTDGETVNKNCYGVFVSDAEAATISNNRFKLELEDGDGTYEVASIYMQAVVKKTITGNNIYTMSDLDDTYGVYIDGTTVGVNETAITGNSIETFISSSLSSTDNIGIFLDVSASNHHRLTCTGNKLEITNNGTGNCYGIQVDGVNNSSTNSASTVTGNSVYVWNTTGTITDLAGIKSRSNNISIANNTVYASHSGSTVTGFGIWAKGHHVTVTGNSIRCVNSGLDSCIYVLSALHGTGGRDGNLIISNNNCVTAGQSPAINMEIVEGVSLRNFAINGNNIVSEPPPLYNTYTIPSGLDTLSYLPCGILMTVSGGTDPQLFQINNNSVHITTEPGAAGQNWHGIYMYGTGAYEGPGGVPGATVMCGNLISRNTGTQELGSNNRAIRVVAATFMSFMGNVVSEWSIAGDDQRRMFEIDADAGSYIGNVMNQQATISVNNSLDVGSYGVAVGNVDRTGGGGISTGGFVLLSTNVYNDLS